MLARVANSLYWTGRYLERSEHLSRYLKVQYFSTFDAPMIQQKEVILRSILFMSEGSLEFIQNGETELSEQEILVEVAFSPENRNSIFSNVQTARENARSVRYAISSELWEAINRYYHFVRSYSVDFYKTRGLYDFTTNAVQHCSVIRSYIDSTLLHDDIWAFIKLGIHLERATQIIRILNNKIIDIKALTGEETDNPLIAYQWTTTLKVLESFDMYRRIYRREIQQKNILTFLLTNPAMSRSVCSTLEQLNFFLSGLSLGVSKESKLQFQARKLANHFKYLEYHEIVDDVPGFLNQSLEKIYELNNLIEKEYFE